MFLDGSNRLEIYREYPPLNNSTNGTACNWKRWHPTDHGSLCGVWLKAVNYWILCLGNRGSISSTTGSCSRPLKWGGIDLARFSLAAVHLANWDHVTLLHRFWLERDEPFIIEMYSLTTKIHTYIPDIFLFNLPVSKVSNFCACVRERASCVTWEIYLVGCPPLTASCTQHVTRMFGVTFIRATLSLTIYVH